MNHRTVMNQKLECQFCFINGIIPLIFHLMDLNYLESKKKKEKKKMLTRYHFVC